MKYNVEEIRYLSSDSEHKVYAKIMSPIGKIKGVVQICHGMNGYIGKYDDLAKILLEKGYVVCGNTHIGHWDSVNNKEELGFFGEFNGYKYLINDVRKLTQVIKKRFPNKDIILFGHSMGSFIARCYIYKYANDLAGVIISGTAGPQPLVESGIQVANLMIQRKGHRYRSRKLYSILFQAANREIKNPTSNFAWITSKKDVQYDRKSDFLFTASGLRDVLDLIKECNDTKKISKLNKELPIYFFSGSEDPIGNYGDGVKKAVALYKKAGVNDVTCKIYKGDRHECLNEINRNEVIENMIEWIEKIIKGRN